MTFFKLSPLLLLAACASVPSGPGVMVLPGSTKTFDQFRGDDYECRQYAHSQVGGNTPDQAGVDAGVRSAAIGAAVGTIAGAAIGGNSSAAATGAGLGLTAGALAGTGTAHATSLTLQQRYDIGYQQCMYAKGHKIPMAASRAERYRAPRRAGAYPPPPPPPPDSRLN
jgi:outer membrane lipoprotein SlyB